jgi:glycosyltransferase involved in cell wall biosynthesis
MRILKLSDVFFPRVNGVSTSIKTFMDGLSSLGHDCILATPEYTISPEIPDSNKIIRLPARVVPFDPEDRLLKWRAFQRWIESIQLNEFDVLHIHTPFTAHYGGVKLGRRLRIPVVETYHTYFEHYLHHYAPFAPAWLTKPLARKLSVSQCHQVDAVISPSPQMAVALRNYGVKTSISVIPTGLPPDAFEFGDRNAFRFRYGIPLARPVALFVGRVAHEKNIDFLLEMCSHLKGLNPDVLLIIAGEGPAEGHLRLRTQSLGLNDHVMFIGYLDRKNGLRDCYRGADVFVFASRTETQGLVLLEALAQGLPVVSTAVMGTADVLQDVKGAIVSPENPNIFAALVADTLERADRRGSLANAAVIDAQRWASAIMVGRLVSFYEEVIDRKRREK